MNTTRVYADSSPFESDRSRPGWEPRSEWPAWWVTPDSPHPPSFAALYRITFQLNKSARIRIHVGADQRYRLWLDGAFVPGARGNQRGMTRSWFYESYDLDLDKGEHTLGALVWYLDRSAPWAQASSGPAFLCAAQPQPFTKLLSTGTGPWECSILENITFLDSAAQIGSTVGCGARVRIDGAPPADAFTDTATRWGAVRTTTPGNNGFRQGSSADTRLLKPGTLPPMQEIPTNSGHVLRADSRAPDEPFGQSDTVATRPWQNFPGGSPVPIPANTRARVLIDIGEYRCAYYALRVSGGHGARISVAWAERLSVSPERPTAPPDRVQVDGLYFKGIADEFLPDGATRTYEPLWWMAGTVILLSVETADQALTLERFDLFATGYPFEPVFKIESADPLLTQIADTAWRTLRMCSHETHMDCPFWEQLQYIGDTRIQALVTYVAGTDDRLARKAIDIFRFAVSNSSPFMSSNCPSRSGQVIAPFALWWVCMLADHARWKGDAAFTRQLLPLAWWVVDHFLLSRTPDGLVVSGEGWNYVDSHAFTNGEPPGATPGDISAIINWQVILALEAIEQMQSWCADPERASLARRLCDSLVSRCIDSFWDQSRGAFADDLAHTSFSEHSQALALLSERLPKPIHTAVASSLARGDNLIKAGPYFTHYICEALALSGSADTLLARLSEWKTYLDAGLTTFPEHSVTDRSDCHAWSAHPLFHMIASVGGIRPGSMGYANVRIAPCIGAMQSLDITSAHPTGLLSVSYRRENNELHATVRLPENLSGVFCWNGHTRELRSGEQAFTLR